MWLVCFGFFSAVSAIPFWDPWGGSELGNYNVQLVEYGGFPQQRQSICLPSPFLRQICLPPALQFFLPLRTLGAGRQRCLSIPIMRTYTVKFCSPGDSSLPKGENSNKTLKEIIKQDETEAETERLRDNANIEVNGGEADSKLFDKKERSDGAEESKLPGKNPEDGNKISRILEEMTADDSPERPPTDDDPDEEVIANSLNCLIPPEETEGREPGGKLRRNPDLISAIEARNGTSKGRTKLQQNL